MRNFPVLKQVVNIVTSVLYALHGCFIFTPKIVVHIVVLLVTTAHYRYPLPHHNTLTDSASGGTVWEFETLRGFKLCPRLIVHRTYHGVLYFLKVTSYHGTHLSINSFTPMRRFRPSLRRFVRKLCMFCSIMRVSFILIFLKINHKLRKCVQSVSDAFQWDQLLTVLLLTDRTAAQRRCVGIFRPNNENCSSNA